MKNNSHVFFCKKSKPDRKCKFTALRLLASCFHTNVQYMGMYLFWFVLINFQYLVVLWWVEWLYFTFFFFFFCGMNWTCIDAMWLIIYRYIYTYILVFDHFIHFFLMLCDKQLTVHSTDWDYTSKMASGPLCSRKFLSNAQKVS